MCRLALLLPLLWIAGCVQSLQPFYTDDQLTFDPAITGHWVDTEGKNALDIPAADADAQGKVYHVTHTDEKGKAGRYVVHLAKVDKYMLADVKPEELQTGDSEQFTAQFLPVHTFFIVEITADELRVRPMSYDWFSKYIKAHPTELAFEQLEGDRIVLTAPTEKLQAFVVKNIDTPEAFAAASVLRRGKPTTAPSK